MNPEKKEVLTDIMERFLNHRLVDGMMDEISDRFAEINDAYDRADGMCNWTQEDDEAYSSLWEGSCGVQFILNDGTPEDNDMVYCHKCGKKISQVRVI